MAVDSKRKRLARAAVQLQKRLQRLHNLYIASVRIELVSYFAAVILILSLAVSDCVALLSGPVTLKLAATLCIATYVVAELAILVASLIVAQHFVARLRKTTRSYDRIGESGTPAMASSSASTSARLSHYCNKPCSRQALRWDLAGVMLSNLFGKVRRATPCDYAISCCG
jgi:hypothetical protein